MNGKLTICTICTSGNVPSPGENVLNGSATVGEDPIGPHSAGTHASDLYGPHGPGVVQCLLQGYYFADQVGTPNRKPNEHCQYCSEDNIDNVVNAEVNI